MAKYRYLIDSLVKAKTHLSSAISTLVNRGTKVGVYGAGESGIILLDVLQKLSCNIIGITDGNPLMHGKKIAGISVVTPEELVKLEPDVIFIAISYQF